VPSYGLCTTAVFGLLTGLPATQNGVLTSDHLLRVA
jgi:hypothetical protein